MQFLVSSCFIIFSTNYNECCLSTEKKQGLLVICPFDAFGKLLFSLNLCRRYSHPITSQSPVMRVIRFDCIYKRRKVKANEIISEIILSEKP